MNYLHIPQVPDKVYHIHEADGEPGAAIDLDMSKTKKKGGGSNSCNNDEEDEFWWNRANLTVLDLSSNSLKSISGDIKNLTDLLTLNVSGDEWIRCTYKELINN